MAYWGGRGGYQNKAYRNHRMHSNLNHINPGLRLQNYDGPFSRMLLTNACDELKCYVGRMQDTAAWYRIRKKTAVEIHGTQYSEDGFGAASTMFSHAELPENKEPQDVFQGMGNDVTMEPPFSVADEPRKSNKQTPSATVTSENLEVINLASNRQFSVGRRDENENSISEEHDDSSRVCTSLPSTSDTVNPYISSESTDGEHGTLCEMFKCDYCSKITKERNSMYSHLVDMVHSSASTVLTDQQGNIVYLKASKTVAYDAAQYEKIVASCTEGQCHLLFDTIFMCNDHYARCHTSQSACYCLVDVVDRIVSKVSYSENSCSVCGEHFKKIKQLNNHYSLTNHYPYITRTDCDTYMLCNYCKKTFTSFKVACGHVKKHVASAINGMLDLIILYVSKEARTYTLLPYQCSTAGEVNSIRSKIQSLQHMKKMNGKRGRADISNEIRDLKQLL